MKQSRMLTAVLALAVVALAVLGIMTFTRSYAPQQAAPETAVQAQDAAEEEAAAAKAAEEAAAKAAEAAAAKAAEEAAAKAAEEAAAKAAEEAAKTVYASDFSKDEDGWYGRGATSVRTADNTLKTTGRQSDWNSPGRNFDLIEGGEYEFSVEVRQDSLDSAGFMISVAHSLEGTESYENLARGEAKKGEWTTLKGAYKAGAFDQYVLYVETSGGAGDLDYEIRHFVLTAPNGLPKAKATEPPMEIKPVDDLPSLKEVYAGKFDFGAAAPQSVFSSPRWMALIVEQFSIVTPENELKPDAVLDVSASKKLVQSTGDEASAAVHFTAAKPLLDFAKKYGIKVHGHVLVWHSQTPEAFFHEGYDAKNPLVGREVMLGRLENYIKGIMEFLEANYPGVVVSWDVLNEAIDDGTNWLRKSKWYTIIGDDFPNRAFELARKYAPEGTKLYYNDYNTAYPAKLSGIVRLLNSLIPDGNIDGYGFQMHHSVGSPTMPQIKAAVDTIAGLGLRLRVSELDIGVSSRTETSLNKQAAMYANIMKLLLKHSDQVEAVQVWGLTDAMSWRSKDNPLLFDASGNPKPAFWAVADPDSVSQ